MILFADLTPTPAAVHDNMSFWYVVITMGANIAIIVALFLKPKGNPQPFDIRFAAEYATKAELEKHAEQDQREHENLFKKIGGVERGSVDRTDDFVKELRTSLDSKLGEMLKEDRVGREKLHDRINQILSGLNRLEGEFNAWKDNQS
jgi:Ribonuclease G/E